MSQLDLLMVHADSAQPVLPKGLAESAMRNLSEADDRPSPSRLTEDEDNPNDLSQQRWGVVIPEGSDGKRLLALIDPLVEARCSAQRGIPIKTYTVPPRLDMAQAMAWKKANYDIGEDTTEDLPRYLLVLGDLDQTPLAVQQALGVDCYVGRLAFDSDQGYESYVYKLLGWERRRSALAPARSLLFTVHDQTAAIESGYRSVVIPGLAAARARKQSGQFKASEILELGDLHVPDPNELLRTVRDPNPATLLTLSHGLGAPRGGWNSPADQRRLQGAMSFGREGCLSGDQLGKQPFLPGGIWFMLACYGAGTPDHSAYLQWLLKLAKAGQFRGQPDSVLAGLPKSGDRPFIASLPKAVLQNPEGPLAFMGHVDLAWTYSCAELDDGKPDPKPGFFMDILRKSLRGDRVGVAFHSLQKYFGQVATRLSTLDIGSSLTDHSDLGSAKRGHLWMLRQDLASYILLGDPAAQLPLKPQEVRDDRTWALNMPPDIEILRKKVAPSPVSPYPPVAPDPTAGSSAVVVRSREDLAEAPQALAAKLPRPIEELEEAIGRIFAGEGVKAVAADYQMEKATLQRLHDQYRKAGRRALGVTD